MIQTKYYIHKKVLHSITADSQYWQKYFNLELNKSIINIKAYLATLNNAQTIKIANNLFNLDNPKFELLSSHFKLTNYSKLSQEELNLARTFELSNTLKAKIARQDYLAKIAQAQDNLKLSNEDQEILNQILDNNKDLFNKLSDL